MDELVWKPKAIEEFSEFSPIVMRIPTETVEEHERDITVKCCFCYNQRPNPSHSFQVSVRKSLWSLNLMFRNQQSFRSFSFRSMHVLRVNPDDRIDLDRLNGVDIDRLNGPS